MRIIQGVAPIPAGYKKTADAEFLDGKIVFRDEAGLKTEAAVDWKFLAD